MVFLIIQFYFGLGVIQVCGLHNTFSSVSYVAGAMRFLCCCLIFILCIWWLGGPSGFKVLRYLFLVFVVFVPFRLA